LAVGVVESQALCDVILVSELPHLIVVLVLLRRYHFLKPLLERLVLEVDEGKIRVILVEPIELAVLSQLGVIQIRNIALERSRVNCLPSE
jgi:hypothetical protein